MGINLLNYLLYTFRHIVFNIFFCFNLLTFFNIYLHLIMKKTKTKTYKKIHTQNIFTRNIKTTKQNEWIVKLYG